jgi:hypothetical protein
MSNFLLVKIFPSFHFFSVLQKVAAFLFYVCDDFVDRVGVVGTQNVLGRISRFSSIFLFESNVPLKQKTQAGHLLVSVTTGSTRKRFFHFAFSPRKARGFPGLCDLGA